MAVKHFVSVAMATYNGASYLQAQLDSFASQTLLPDELVVCDDGSCDDSVEILDRFKVRVPFAVHVHRNAANLGYIRNFEKALSLCTGDIIFLSDQDDVWFDDKIAKVIGQFERNPSAMVVLNDQLIADSELRPSGATKLQNIIGYGGSATSFVTGCCSAHRRQWLSIVLPIPGEAPAHDDWINGVAHGLGVVHILAEPLQLYRRHTENVSNNVASSRKRLSRLDRLRRFDPRGAEPRWRRSIQYNEAVCRRISEKRGLLAELGYARNAQLMVEQLDEKQAALRQRLDIYALSGAKRWTAILRLWRSGGYRFFGNLRSVFKDVLWAVRIF